MPVTIKDIAKIAGVSRGTVDKALNNRPGISDATREAVLKIAKDMDYQPNLLGKTLVQTSNPTKIGVIVTPGYNPFIQLIKNGVEEAQSEFGPFNVQTIVKEPITMDIKEQLWMLDELENEGVKGVAVLPAENADVVNKLNEMAESGIAIVTFNSDVTGINRICHVGQDNYRGGRTAGGLMEKALTPGSEVGVIVSSRDLSSHVNRYEGFESRLRESNKNIGIVEVLENLDARDAAYKQTMIMLERHPELKGIYITGGGTIGVARALELARRDQDVTLICHNILDENKEYMKRGIIDFAVEQDGYRQGYMSVKILFEYLVKMIEPAEDYINMPVMISTGDAIEP